MSEPKGGNIPQLSQRVEDLIRQLVEAEAALAEALGGKVDAVINSQTATPILLQQAQQRLQESETRYRRLISNMSAVIFELEPDGQILFVNQAITAMTGYRPEDLLGNNWWDVFFPAGQRQQVEAVLAAVQRGDIRNYELMITARTGALVTLAVNTANHYGRDHTLERVLGFGVDITQRKQAERELDEYRSRLEELVATRTADLTAANEALQTEIAEHHRAQERAVQLQTITAALSRALTPAEIANIIISQGGSELKSAAGALTLLNRDSGRFETIHSRGMPEDMIAAWHKDPVRLAALLSEGTPLWLATAEDRIVCLPDTAQWVAPFAGAWAVLPLILQGEFLGTLTFAFTHEKAFSEPDRAFMVTLLGLCTQGLERARLYEAESLARQAAETANQLKTRFLGMVSHELRTPLASIKGFVSTLRATDVSWEAKSQQEYLQIIDEEADKLTELVEQLLDVSRLQAGQLAITAEPNQLADVVSLASPQIQALVSTHQLTTEIPDILPSIMIDSRRIAQVLVNLIGNAAKYSPVGTQITLRAQPADNFVRIDVVDEGEGIPLHNREAVFEAFRQMERRDDSQKGAGLGLTICKGLVEAHGGRIWIERNHSGPGTTFSFTLPIAPRS